MITVLHRGGLANDYSIPWILGCYIRNNISKDLTKNIFFFSWQKVISGSYVKTITTLHRGGSAKWLQYYTIIYGGGALGTPKNDCVIYVRP